MDQKEAFIFKIRIECIALFTQTNRQSPCRVNIHPVSKLLGRSVKLGSRSSFFPAWAAPFAPHTERMVKAANQ